MRRQTKDNSNSIIWTIDPYETKNAHRAPLAKFLKVLSRGLSGKVMPFSVVSPGPLSWTVPIDKPMELELARSGTSTVKRNLKSLHMQGIAPPTVEFHKSASRRELVEDVIRFSKTKKANFIAVNTRKLLSPFPFKIGGFAEALIGKSNLPIIAVSPKAKIPNKVRSILFATDLSPRSHKAFRKTVKLASKLGAKMSLLHLETPATTSYPLADIPISMNESWRIETEAAQMSQNKKIATRWCAEAKRHGVPCTYQVSKAPTSVAKAILQGAKKYKSDLISLASYRNPRTPAVIGGTIRDVLSSARTPVLEIHSA